MSLPVAQNPIRLVLIDDCGLFRASLARLLASEPGFAVIGECSTSAEALEMLKGASADIVLLDFDLGAERGQQFIAASRQAGYRGKFLLVASASVARAATLALKLGASGVFLKSEAPERLVHAIRLVAEGEVWVDPKIIQMLAEHTVDRLSPPDRGPVAELEERERSVLLGILEGRTNREIGDNIGISESSVKNTVQRLFGKTGVKTRSQLVRVAIEGSLDTTNKKFQPTRRAPADNLSPARHSPN
jgi:DNA-binding NarL/FixJ family response regulator